MSENENSFEETGSQNGSNFIVTENFKLSNIVPKMKLLKKNCSDKWVKTGIEIVQKHGKAKCN